MRLRRNQIIAQMAEAADIKRSLAPPRLNAAPPVEVSASLSPADAARARRLAAIMSVHGMWKDDSDKPQDAVAYQREARSEWR